MGVLFPQVPNPCEDEKYLEFKKKSLDDMSDREYEYFMQKDKECSEYNLKQTDLREKGNNSDFNFNSSLGVYVKNLAFNTWTINGYQRKKDSWGYGCIFSLSTDFECSVFCIFLEESEQFDFLPYISYEFPTSSGLFSPLIVIGGNYSYTKWRSFITTDVNNPYNSSYSKTASGTVTNISPFFGFGLDVKISKKYGFGIKGLMLQSYQFTRELDGSSEVHDKQYNIYPIFTINIFDPFKKKKPIQR